MEKDKQSDISSAQAVLLGALAPGVNGPTWNTLKSAFLLLGLCLAMMLVLAFSSSDSSLVIHVGFLVTITATLFLLLSWFLSQTGLVSIEHQMREMDLVPKDQGAKQKETFLSQTGLVSIEHQMREMDLVPEDQGAKHKET